MIRDVTLEKTTYTTAPLKFEAGTPMIAEAIGLSVALDYLMDIGLHAIEAKEQQLLAYVMQQMEQIEEVRLIGTARHKGAILSFVVKDLHPLDLATLLDCRGIAIRSGHHCSQPTMAHFGVSATARLSFGLYNTHEEVDQFIQSLTTVLNFSCV